MQPSSETPSPLESLRQLEALLAAGTLTPQEFDTLKQRLLADAAPTADAPTPVGPPPTAPAAPVVMPAGIAFTPAPVVPDAPLAPLADLAGPPLLPLPPADPTSTPARPYPDSIPGPPLPYLDSASALTPEAAPLFAPEPDWLAAPAPALFAPANELALEKEDDDDELPDRATERRNPLSLVFALGGLLLFLGVMAYLLLGRHPAPDEHLTSTSQTAADTTAVVPEVGPQAEQLTLPPVTGPDTVREVPLPPPATVVDEATAGTDSTAAMPEEMPTPAPAPVVPATPKPAPTKPATAAPKPAATPVAAPTPADTTGQ